MLPDDLSDVVIELTEHEVYVGDSLLADSLASLRERGARIAIDDAGAGYAGPEAGHVGAARTSSSSISS